MRLTKGKQTKDAETVTCYRSPGKATPWDHAQITEHPTWRSIARSGVTYARMAAQWRHVPGQPVGGEGVYPARPSGQMQLLLYMAYPPALGLSCCCSWKAEVPPPTADRDQLLQRGLGLPPSPWLGRGWATYNHHVWPPCGMTHEP